jgi:hypothetical protein
MKLAFRVSCLTLALAASSAALVGMQPATAEPVIDRALSGVDFVKKGACGYLRVNFNIRIRYVSHFPADRGEQLKISLRGLDLGAVQGLTGVGREGVRPPENKFVGVRSIEFQSNVGEGPLLLIQFAQSVAYQIGQGEDFQSIVIAIGGKDAAKACKPVYPQAAVPQAVSVPDAPPTPPPARDMAAPRKPDGDMTRRDGNNAARLLADARDALTASDPERAVKNLTAILSYPENPQSAQAQELLGVARQRMGDKPQARAEFEEYLKRYPNGDAAERVRQRLDALVTAEKPPAEKLPESGGRGGSSERTKEPGPTVLSVNGSVSSFYTRDQGIRTFQDPTLPPVLNRDPADAAIYSDTLISNIDFNAMWGNDRFKTKFRFSGAEENNFSGDRGDIASVSALYADTSIKDWNFQTRVGRQTANSGGVLGRFDGATASVGVMEGVKVSAVAGSPVVSRVDMPFKEDKYFYGGSVNVALGKGFDTTFYGIQQEAEGHLDRQAVGSEFRYFDTNKTAFGAADYDVYFGQLNLATLNTTWTMPDKSVISAAGDYRRAPFLSTWNALMSQPYGSLKELYQHYTRSQIDQMALDRTATAKSATVGYSVPLSKSLQLSLDATWSNISATGGTDAINGNPAIPAGVSTGDEFYYSAQLTGNDFLSTGDIWVLGLRYVDRQASDTYAVDMNVRYPITEDWRVNPRIRLAYETGPNIEDYQVQPSLLLNYAIAKNLNFEVEGGTKWQWTTQGTANAKEFEYYFTVGLRYDFNIDDVLHKTDLRSELWRK